MHQQMERMAMVVTLVSDLAQPDAQLFDGQEV
jgi:hypothetical protein